MAGCGPAQKTLAVPQCQSCLIYAAVTGPGVTVIAVGPGDGPGLVCLQSRNSGNVNEQGSWCLPGPQLHCFNGQRAITSYDLIHCFLSSRAVLVMECHPLKRLEHAEVQYFNMNIFFGGNHKTELNWRTGIYSVVSYTTKLGKLFTYAIDDQVLKFRRKTFRVPWPYMGKCSDVHSTRQSPWCGSETRKLLRCEFQIGRFAF